MDKHFCIKIFKGANHHKALIIIIATEINVLGVLAYVIILKTVL